MIEFFALFYHIIIMNSFHSLRSAADDTYTQFVVPRCRTRLADRSISVMGPKWWNALPKDLKCIASEIAFRKRLKAHLFEQFYA